MVLSGREKKLEAGTKFNYSGEFITLRDQSLLKMFKWIDEGKSLSFKFEDVYLFFAAPTPGYPENRASIGPTTSWRMGKFIPRLVDFGAKGFVGKGSLPDEVASMIRDKKAYYFQAIGGAGAYYGSKIVAIEPIMFPELGPEAVFKVKVVDFPLIVSIDKDGRMFF